MPKTHRLRDALILTACLPWIGAVVAVAVVREVVDSLVELRRGDRAGLWGAS
jgi:hypothetical protein